MRKVVLKYIPQKEIIANLSMIEGIGLVTDDTIYGQLTENEQDVSFNNICNEYNT